MNYQNNASLHAQLGSAGASGGSPLLAQVGLIVAPEKRLLQEFFLTVDKDIRSRGCHLAVSTDFREFKELSLALGKTFFPAFDPDLHDLNPDHVFRSEEHTSELQSLMRISYAVFCLKKKKRHSTNYPQLL